MINKSMKYYLVPCFWCKKEMNQRQDTYKRQLLNYGHHCCKKCFGNEPTFKNSRSRVMTINNPFKGKSHSNSTKLFLASLKIGLPTWNKGLTKETNESVKLYSEKSKATKLLSDIKGEKNPNWKGGISNTKKNIFKLTSLKVWMAFRKTILTRDGWRCGKCGNDDKRYLRVHHLSSQKIFPELIYEPQNCFTFCEKCHRLFHKKYGIKNFKPLHLKEFLNEDRKPENYFKFD